MRMFLPGPGPLVPLPEHDIDAGTPPTWLQQQAPSRYRRSQLTQPRGRQWWVPVPAQVVLLSWPPPKLGAPRRLLASAQKGRRTSPPSISDQPFTRPGRRLQSPPVSRARMRSRPYDQDTRPPSPRGPRRLVLPRRGRHATATQPQAAPTPSPKGTARRPTVLRRGRHVTPTRPQVNPPFTAPKLGSPRRLLNRTAKGRQWSAAVFTVTTPPVLVWPPPRIGVPRRLLAVRRGRQTNPTLTQATVIPPTIPGNRWSSARSRMAATRQGHRYSPPWPIIVIPTPPTICPPTKASIAAYTSIAAVSAYTSAAKVSAYSSTSTLTAYLSNASIDAYAADSGITAYTTGGAIVIYTSSGRIGPCFPG